MEVTFQSQSYLWFCLLLFSFIIVKGAVNYSKCSHVKGPWLASVSSLWLFRATIMGRTQVDCAEALAKYGTSGPASSIRGSLAIAEIWPQVP